MTTQISGAPITALEGETKTLATSAGYLAVKPGFSEIKAYCATSWRAVLSPKLLHCLLFASSAYTDYTTYVTDGSSATHMPLDGMTTAKYVYMGFADIPLGVYFDVGTNVNDQAATLDVEYCYDSADASYKKITGTISGALTVGETVTGGTSGATGTLVYSGATYIVVKAITGVFQLAETISGAAQNCSAVTAIDTNDTAAFFTDVAGGSDGTTSTGKTLAQDGVYTWTLPAIVPSHLGTFQAPVYSKCYWIKFAPSATLAATLDINEIIPVYKNANYGYFEAGFEYNFTLSSKVGGLVVAATAGTPTLNVTWIR